MNMPSQKTKHVRITLRSVDLVYAIQLRFEQLILNTRLKRITFRNWTIAN